MFTIFNGSRADQNVQGTRLNDSSTTSEHMQLLNDGNNVAEDEGMAKLGAGNSKSGDLSV